MNAEKHERSLLKVVSDAGSTPAASTIAKLLKINGYIKILDKSGNKWEISCVVQQQNHRKTRAQPR